MNYAFQKLQLQPSKETIMIHLRLKQSSSQKEEVRGRSCELPGIELMHCRSLGPPSIHNLMPAVHGANPAFWQQYTALFLLHIQSIQVSFCKTLVYFKKIKQ